jgi:hypothetical protein
MLYPLSLPIFPVVFSRCFPHFLEIPAAIVPALCVVGVAQTLTLGTQYSIRSFPVLSPPLSLVSIPLAEVFRSPFVSCGFLALGMPCTPATARCSELGAVLASPPLLGR